MSQELPLDIEQWPTKQMVADAIGKSLTAVTRLVEDGTLNPLIDAEGRKRYPPAEVAVLVSRVQGAGKQLIRKEEFKEFELDVIRSIVGLVKDPREKIDAILFKMIDDLRIENSRLLAIIQSQQADVEAAKDQSAERTMALDMVKSDTRIKETALLKIMEKASLLFGGGGKVPTGGVTLTPDQLEELLLAGEFFTPEQVNMAKAIVTKHKAMQPKPVAQAAATPNTETTNVSQ